MLTDWMRDFCHKSGTLLPKDRYCLMPALGLEMVKTKPEVGAEGRRQWLKWVRRTSPWNQRLCVTDNSPLRNRVTATSAILLRIVCWRTVPCTLQVSKVILNWANLRLDCVFSAASLLWCGGVLQDPVGLPKGSPHAPVWLPYVPQVYYIDSKWL